MSLNRSFVLTLILFATAPVYASQNSCGADLDSVELRNGDRVPSVSASMVTLQIETLLKASPGAYRDLVTLARNDGTAIAEESRTLMDQIGLLNDRGELSKDARAIAVSSAEDAGDGEVRYTSPIAPLNLNVNDLDAYHAHVAEIANDVVALAHEKNFPLEQRVGEHLNYVTHDAGILTTNGGLAVRVDAEGIPLYFLTPTGSRHYFVAGATTRDARVDFVHSLEARFGTRPLPERPNYLALTKDRHANPLPDPEFNAN